MSNSHLQALLDPREDADDNKLVLISGRLPADEHAELKELAQAHGLAIGALVIASVRGTIDVLRELPVPSTDVT